jgi:glycosyltransferase involved in cell wall biosynthesis
LLDIGPAVHQGAGLARYAERLAATLLATCADELSLSLFYNRHSGHTPPATLATVPAYSVEAGQLRWRLSALAGQLTGRPNAAVRRALQSMAHSDEDATTGAPLYHATEHLLPRLAAESAGVITVHDLIFERFPEHHTRRNVAFLRAALPRFVAAADAVIAVSAHTRDDLIGLYGLPSAKITVIHEGIDAAFQPAPEAERARVRATYSPDRPWLLMVGTLEPRKNHATALRALHRLRDEGFPHRLLIAGGKGWLFEPIAALVEELGLQNDVTFTGYVPAEDLPALYSAAACVLLPSLHEGFGFPVLEAMACGAPVVCSNVSSLPEVAGDAALLVPPTDADALAAALRLVLTQPQLAARMREAGLRQAARFTWERCVRETAALYAETAARHAHQLRHARTVRA